MVCASLICLNIPEETWPFHYDGPDLSWNVVSFDINFGPSFVRLASCVTGSCIFVNSQMLRSDGRLYKMH